MHDDYHVDGMSDFMCTNAVQYLIRDGKVHALVYMSSNDAVFGYKNDYAWQKHVLQQLVSDLNDNWIHVEVGNIYWNVASMHVYERHFHLIDNNYANK
jgi:thymidylate synthase